MNSYFGRKLMQKLASVVHRHTIVVVAQNSMPMLHLTDQRNPFVGHCETRFLGLLWTCQCLHMAIQSKLVSKLCNAFVVERIHFLLRYLISYWSTARLYLSNKLGLHLSRKSRETAVVGHRSVSAWLGQNSMY